MRSKLFFNLLDMKLDATRADHIVGSSDDAELLVCVVLSYLNDIVGNQLILADMWRIDDELTNISLTIEETEVHTTERLVPL